MTNATETKKTVSLKELAESRSEVFNIDPFKLSIKKGWNCREWNFNPAAFTFL